MAEIDNPQLKDLCNSQLRVLADKLTSFDTQAQAAIAVYNARNLGTVISDAGSTNLITDGSATDGRTRCTGGDVWNFVTLLQDLETFMTQGRRDVLSKWRVNGGQ